MSTTEQPAGRPLRPVAAIFLIFGMFWGCWAVAAADVERFLHLSHRGFGLLLAAGVAGGAAATAAAGPLTDRIGTSRALVAVTGTWAAGTAVLASRHHPVAFEALFVLTVSLGGAVDVVMNVGATAVLAGRPGALARFHAWFNSGALIGAALTGTLGAIGWSWRWSWAALAVATLPALVWVNRRPLPRPPPAEPTDDRSGKRDFRSRWLLALALAFGCSAMAEGGIDSWGVLFLRSQLEIGALAGAAAYVLGQALATSARVVLGPVAGSRGSASGARIGATVAAIGLAVEATSPSPVPAALGLAAAALGISLCWPLLLGAAAAGAERPAVVVGAVTASGYVGFLVGPVVVGAIAGSWGLRAGLLALAGAAAVTATVVPSARHTSSAEGGGSTDMEPQADSTSPIDGRR